MRVVNAMDAPISVDLRQILAELNISTASAASATATVPAGDNPYAGRSVRITDQAAADRD